MSMDINTKIADLVHTLGTEHDAFYPTAYATAWVARVPEFKHLLNPAFPQSLKWLRENQLVDGGWGTVEPMNPFANTLSTLAALLALKHWDKQEDQVIISRAVKALNELAPKLTSPDQKTFGFELLLTGLIEEAQAKNIELSSQTLAIYQNFLQMGNAQRDMLKNVLKQMNYQNPNVFWLCLEMLGADFMMDNQQAWPFSSDVLADNGSLLAATTATAYFLAANRYRDKDLPMSCEYLNKIVVRNHGGVPPYQPMEEFEISFALDFLLKGDVPIQLLEPAIKQLHQHWNKKNGLGYSIYSPSLDADDTAIGIIVLKKAGIDVDYKNLLEFFNGEYFFHYKEDPTPSVSVNANALRALCYFSAQEEVSVIMNKTLNWVRSIFKNSFEDVFHDTWHVSPFYAASAIIFALAELDKELTMQCIDWVIAHQKRDGGWGFASVSTFEETALAILCLNHAKQLNYPVDNKILRQAKEYFTANKLEPAKCLFKGTTLVCPPNVVNAAIYAANYAVSKIN